MALRPAHALATLLLEDPDLRSALLAVDDGDHAGVGDERGAGENLSAVLFDKQDFRQRQLGAGLASGAGDVGVAAAGDPQLMAAGLDDCVHILHLCKGFSLSQVSLVLSTPDVAVAGLGPYFSRTRVPLIF